MLDKTFDFQNDKLEFIKNPVVAEFLGLAPNSDYQNIIVKYKIYEIVLFFCFYMLLTGYKSIALSHFHQKFLNI